MKNYSRIISIMLAIIMVLTSFSAVFAEGTEGTTEEPAKATTEKSDAVVNENETDATVNARSTNSVENPSEEEEEAETVVTVIINYLYDKRVRETTGKIAAPTVTQEYKLGDSYSVESPEISGYTPTMAVVEGTITSESENTTTINVYYYPDVTLTIKYVYSDNIKDKAGEEIAPAVTNVYKLWEDYSVESPKITGYAPSEDVVAGKVTSKTDIETEITVTYEAVPTEPVSNLKLHPSYKSIILTWDRVPDAKEYLILRSTSAKPTDDTFVKYAVVKNSNSKTITFEDLKANGAVGDFHLARWYFYRVYAISQSGRSSKGIWINGTAVRPMYEKITFKAGVTLQPHGGQWKSHYFRAGQKVMAQGFGGGKFIFWYKGTKYYANYVRVKNCTAEYVSNSKSKSYSGIWATQRYASGDATGTKVNFNGIKCYDKTSAERFVNLIGKGSGSKYLIWVSTYHQHVYVFQGKKGAWKLIKDWECATGAAESPTPTGAEKRLERRVSYRHGVRWWRPFQTWNSIHGKLQSWSMGGPASNGCVRNFDQNAKWIYDNCPNGTGLIVW